MIDIKGLTWDHPRGYRALQKWAADDDNVCIRWEIQQLEGFESHPIDELAADYDLLVVDNPGIGEAVEKRCIRPLQEVLSAEQLSFLKANAIGASFQSYEYAGQHWAIPIDGASQVCAYIHQEDLRVPATWHNVIDISQIRPGTVALSLGGPHALLTFYSICQSLGGKLFEQAEQVVAPAIGMEALEIMAAIFRQQNKELLACNPIALLDEMARGTFHLCPAIFGYVNYTSPTAGIPVHFTNIPHCGNASLRGSVLGGTGIAFTTRSEIDEKVVEHIMRYVSDSIQANLVVQYGGQPANRHAWLDSFANAHSRNFFINTYDTVSKAYVRPKYAGYIHFQDASSQLIRAGLEHGDDAEEILQAINRRYRASQHGE